MAKEIFLNLGVTGLTSLYAAIRRPADGFRWYTVTPAWEAYNAAHVTAGYAIALTEEGGDGNYYADFPVGIVGGGLYELVVRNQLGATPVWPTDTIVATGTIVWAGTGVAIPMAYTPVISASGDVTVGGYATGQDPAALVLNAVEASYNTAGTIGAAINIAGKGVDPWLTALPGSYSAGEAGYIVGHNLDAAVSGRMATYAQPAGFLTATFPGTVASPTNITAGTVTGVTNPVSLPLSVPSGYATSANQTSILNAVTAITTNTARASVVAPTYLLRPSSATLVYELDLRVYSLQGVPEVPDAAPTVHARDAAGGSMDTGLSATTMTLVSTGHYTVTYTVNSTDATGEIFFDFGWTVGAVAMTAAAVSLVEDVESASTLTAIKAVTDKFIFDGSNFVKSDPQTVVTVGGYASGQDPATLVLDVAAASHDLANSIGAVLQIVDSDTPGTTTLLTRLPSVLTLTSGAVNVNLNQNLGAGRNVRGMADTVLTVNDALICALSSAAGPWDNSTDTSLIIASPGGTTLQDFAITLASPGLTIPVKRA